MKILLIFMFLGLFLTLESKEKGLASFYSNSENGLETACGLEYNEKELTAAHKTLPFGTKVWVKNISNNKSVIVTITDRGPFVDNRIIDLSQRSFELISLLKNGIIDVELHILKLGDNKQYHK